MRFSNKVQKPGNSSFMLIAFVVVLCVPNVVICINERMSLPATAANLLLPLGGYLLLLSISRNIGKTILALLPMTVLCAFQVVLFFLYGSSIIGVDMFLNTLTTTASEVGELLNNLGSALATVFVLYLPPLVWAVANLLLNSNQTLLNRNVQVKSCQCGFICTLLGLASLGWAYASVPNYAISEDIFPVNVIDNFIISCKRVKQNNNYLKTSADFRFNAEATHPTEAKEIYVVVIGETGRADNYGIFGYDRDTTPLLSKTSGLVTFSKVLSESNTTHKSVPMLLSLINAENFDSINYQKSIITAFNEAGFATAFISTQPLNRSYIDYFGNEAKYVNFVNANCTGQQFKKDEILLTELEYILNSTNQQKQVIFIHTYGSHFNYTDRYDRRFAHFLPDYAKEATARNREALVNAYDNTILHTDYLLHSIIVQLEKRTDAVTAMLYVTDHGEDIFDDNRERFLHASPTPTYWQLHVPMMIWMSDAYRSAFPEKWDNACNHTACNISSSRAFAPTVLDVAGISSPIVADGSSVVGKDYKESGRVYVNDRNHCIKLSEAGMKDADFALIEKLQ